MLGKLLIFTLTMLGVFALLLATVPSDFLTAGYYYNPSARDVEVEEEFDANGMVVYSQTGRDNMTYTYDSLFDGSGAPNWEAGLPTGQFLQVWWGLTVVGNMGIKSIRLVHKQQNWFFGSAYYTDIATLNLYYTDGTPVVWGIRDTDLSAAWNSATNSSAFTGKSNAVTTNFIVKRYNSTKTIKENWDEGTLQYYLTYEANFSAMDVGAFTLIGKLLTFQAPDIMGVSGVWGTLLNSIIAIPTWCAIAYILYKVIAGLIPWLSGGSGD